MKYFIITGASKGLGEALAIELISEDHHLLCIARNESDRLSKLAAAKNCKLDFFHFDLAYLQDIPGLLRLIFQKISLEKASGIYLVNNAGLIHPVDRVEACDAQSVEVHMRVNLIAPMLLTAAFIKHSQAFEGEKRVLHISSGAAVNPYPGWSSYCTGKAGLEMFSACVAAEQEKQPHPVASMAVAPGIIDTGMQSSIRASTEAQFPLRQKFVDLKESGQLVPPGLAGKQLASLLLSRDFKSGERADIRHNP